MTQGPRQPLRLKRAKLSRDTVDVESVIEAANQARRAAADAAATITQLRALAASVAKISLTVLARASVMGRFPWVDKLALRDQLLVQLHDLGVSPDEVGEADATLRDFVRFRLGWSAADAAKATCLARHGPHSDQHEDLSARLRDLFDFPRRRLPSAKQLRHTIGEYSSQTALDYLDDLEHFEDSGVVQHPALLDKELK